MSPTVQFGTIVLNSPSSSPTGFSRFDSGWLRELGFRRLLPVCCRPRRVVRSFLAAELAEAASRTGDLPLVERALEWLSERTRVPCTEWAIGIEARVRARLSKGDVVDALYRKSIERLGRTRRRVELARAYLLHGEVSRRHTPRIKEASVSTENAVRSNTEVVRENTRRVFNEHNPDRASEFLAPEMRWHGGLLGTVEGVANVTTCCAASSVRYPTSMRRSRP